MNTKVTIKNFRVFDENGVTIDLKPLTILTGCNSSGKSSIVKGISLLSQFVQNIIDAKNDGRPIRLGDYKLDFTAAPNNLLGNFEQVINKEAKEKAISFAYQVHSSILHEDVEVELTFGLLEQDFMRDGYLQRITIKNVSSEVLYSSDNEGTLINYILLKTGLEQWFKKQYEKKDIDEAFVIAQGIIGHDLISYMPLLDKLNNLEKTDVRQFLLGRLEKYVINRLSKTSHYSIKDNDGIRRKLESDAKKYGIDNPTLLSDKELFGIYIKSRAEVWKLKLTSLIEHYEQSKYFLFSDYLQSLEKEQMYSFCTEKDLSSLSFSSSDLNLLFGLSDNNYLEEVSTLKYVCTEEDETMYWQKEKGDSVFGIEFVPFRFINEYVSSVLTDIVSDGTMKAISYVSSDLVTIKRLYSFDAKDDFTSLLKQYLGTRNTNSSIRSGNSLAYCDNPFEIRMGEFANKWLREFGIGDRLIVKSVEEGLGAQVRIFGSKEDKEGRLSADFGYGITQLIALLLSIEINKGKTIAIEEPEIHLHPNFQSKLADMFYEAYSKFGVHFIIETHSEYLIRKSQVLVAEMGFTSNKETEEKCPFQSYYIPLQGKPYSLGYRKDGKFKEDFGSGFYDEASNLAFDIL